MAPSTPSGTAITEASAVISIVPSTAGPIPPTFAGATFTGIELVRKDQLMTEAPLATTVYRTNPSGMITRTNEITISTVAMRFLVRRQPAGSRRSTCCSALTAAIRHPASAGRSAPRPRGQ
jgi:hypothetical protein